MPQIRYIILFDVIECTVGRLILPKSIGFFKNYKGEIVKSILKHFSMFILIIIFVSFRIFSEEESNNSDIQVKESKVENINKDQNFSITVYPFLTCYLAYNSFYYTLTDDDSEYSFSNFISAEVEIKINNYISFSTEFREMAYTDFSDIYGIFLNSGPGFRFYFAGEGMYGVFLGNYIQFAVLYENQKNGDSSGPCFLLPYKQFVSTHYIGYRKRFKNFHAELSLGIVTYFDVSGESEKFDWLLLPIIGIGLGKTF